LDLSSTIVEYIAAVIAVVVERGNGRVVVDTADAFIAAIIEDITAVIAVVIVNRRVFIDTAYTSVATIVEDVTAIVAAIIGNREGKDRSRCNEDETEKLQHNEYPTETK